MSLRKIGVAYATVDGEPVDVKGAVEYNLGLPMREAVVGVGGMHGVKETDRAPWVQFTVTRPEAKVLQKLLNAHDATATVGFRDGTVFTVAESTFVGEGDINSEEDEVQLRYEGRSGDFLQ